MLGCGDVTASSSDVTGVGAERQGGGPSSSPGTDRTNVRTGGARPSHAAALAVNVTCPGHHLLSIPQLPFFFLHVDFRFVCCACAACLALPLLLILLGEIAQYSVWSAGGREGQADSIDWFVACGLRALARWRRGAVMIQTYSLPASPPSPPATTPLASSPPLISLPALRRQALTLTRSGKV